MKTRKSPFKSSLTILLLFAVFAATAGRNLFAQSFSIPGLAEVDAILSEVQRYVNMTQEIADGNFRVIPYAGGYISMAQEIANGNFSAVPYAGLYLNMAQNAGLLSVNSEDYSPLGASPVLFAQELNFSPEEFATGVNVNLYEMTALYKTQFARLHPLEELYPANQQYDQEITKNNFVVNVARRVDPNFDTLSPLAKGELFVKLFCEFDKATTEELKTRGEIVYNAIITPETIRIAVRSGGSPRANPQRAPKTPLGRIRAGNQSLPQNTVNYLDIQVDYRHTVAAQLALARYGFELAKRDETREIGEKYLCDAETFMNEFYAENIRDSQSQNKSNECFQYANALDNFATHAMTNGDSERALNNFREARAVREKLVGILDESIQAKYLAESDERLARFYLAQYQFEEARKHVDAYLKERPETPKDSDETKFLRAEMLSNRALASFFEGRDDDAQRDLEKANLVFADVPKYYKYLIDYNQKYPNVASLPIEPQEDDAFISDEGYRLRRVWHDDKWKYPWDYINEKAAAEKNVRKFEWTYDKLIANHIRLAQIHTRRLRYQEAEKELEDSETMKRAAFDYWRRYDVERVFGDNPLYRSALYFVDKDTGGAFIRDEKNGAKWLNADEKTEREEVWNKIFAFQTVFEQNVRASSKVKQDLVNEAIELYDKNVKTIKDNGYGEESFMIETLRLRATAQLESKNETRLDEAKRDADAARELLEKQTMKNPQYEGLVATLSGKIAFERNEFEDAANYFADAREKYDEIRASNALWVDLLYGEARLAHAKKRGADALRTLDDALKRTREIRRVVSVDDRDRAVQFAAYYDLYVTKVQWLYDELPSADGVRKAEIYAQLYNTLETSRAQGFLDIMKRANVALTAGLPTEDAIRINDELHQQEERARLAKIELLRAVNSGESQERLAILQSEYDKAQAQATQAYDAAKAGNSAFRKFTDPEDAENFEAIVEDFKNKKTLVCEYMIGEEASFLLAYGRGCDEPILLKLEISDEQAKVFSEHGVELERGALTGEKLHQIFGTKKAEGLLGYVQARNSAEIEEDAHALWEILFPDETLRSALQTSDEGTYTLVAPDGVLSRLPFEMLVVDMSGRNARYLLDEETVLFYAPSISVYRRLKDEKRADAQNATLSVGAPVYVDLKPLPETENEVNKVNEICKSKKIYCKRLLKKEATEGNIRLALEDRKTSNVHLACHGVVAYNEGVADCKLVVTKGENENEKNDGFITLAEFFELNLKNCNCATLSACDTNYGELQNGEGSFTLCRGAIAAGAANVVASNWSVDDASSSSIVSQFFEAFLSDKDVVDYAVALKKAKRDVKNKLAWQDPFYWAPFVLIGTGNREADEAPIPSDKNRSQKEGGKKKTATPATAKSRV